MLLLRRCKGGPCVDRRAPTTPSPPKHAHAHITITPHTSYQIENPWLRRAAKLAAAYRAALRPRLLVPVGLAAAIGAWNRLSGAPLPLLYEGCIAGGFLAYKGALLAKLLDELLPKSLVAKGESRPVVDKIDDELDQWGRPKKAGKTPIDALPAEAQAKARAQLEEQAARDAERERLLAEREARQAAEDAERRRQRQQRDGLL